MKDLSCEKAFGLFFISLDKFIKQISVDATVNEESLLYLPVFEPVRTKSFPPSVFGKFGASRFILFFMTWYGFKEREGYDDLLYIRPAIECEKLLFQISSGKTIHEPGFILQPYDQVVVRTSPTYATQKNVSVTGSVNFAGQYAMSSRNYRLSDLIKDAGGLTSLGYAKGVPLFLLHMYYCAFLHISL